MMLLDTSGLLAALFPDQRLHEAAARGLCSHVVRALRDAVGTAARTIYDSLVHYDLQTGASAVWSVPEGDCVAVRSRCGRLTVRFAAWPPRVVGPPMSASRASEAWAD